jgi:subtilisin family serine protease
MVVRRIGPRNEPLPSPSRVTGESFMAQKSDIDTADTPKSGAASKNPPASAGAQSGGTGSTGRGDGGNAARKGVRVSSQERRQYLIASRRRPGVTPFGASPLSLDVVEQALRASPDIEVIDRLGPKPVLGMLADGMPGTPHVIVARMEHSKAETLNQQAQGQLIVEHDQPLTLLDAPFVPPMITTSAAGGGATAPAAVQMLVLGTDDTPVEGAEVYLYGSLLPAMGVTNSAGQVTLSLLADTSQSIRGLYVRPKSDYWSFYQSRPVLDPAQPNIVTLRALSDSFPDFPDNQVMGWGQKAMRLEQIPPDRRGQGIKIAIVDSGAATTHEDLRAISNGFDVVGKKTGANNWMVDTLAHGSHCVGIIAGGRHEKVATVGFAPAAEVHVCKIFPGGQISRLIDALEYCIEQQVDIVNLSVGADQVSELLEQQLIRVTSLGIACIAAAGNSGGPVQYPASSGNVLAVAALGRLGEFPSDSYHAQMAQGAGVDGYFSPRFTCYGPEIALCAPGVAVVSCVPPNNFAAWDGTSMAASHVSGLAALVLAHHPDFAGPFKVRNAQRVERLFQILKASARPINVGDPRRTGFGIPDAPTALGLQFGTQVLSQAQLAQQVQPGQNQYGPTQWPMGNLVFGAMRGAGSTVPWSAQPGYWPGH